MLGYKVRNLNEFENLERKEKNGISYLSQKIEKETNDYIIFKVSSKGFSRGACTILYDKNTNKQYELNNDVRLQNKINKLGY